MNVTKFSCLPVAKNAWKSLPRYWMSTHSRYHKGSSPSSEEFKLLMFMNQCFLVVSFHSCKIRLNKSVHYFTFIVHSQCNCLPKSESPTERKEYQMPTNPSEDILSRGRFDRWANSSLYICFSLLNYIHEEFDIDDEVTIYIFIF